MRTALFSSIALMVFCGAPDTRAAALDAWPERPIRFIVPFPPGGGNDIVGRIVAARLQEALKQSVLVDNRGGAGSTLGTDAAAKSPPDGYTLLINNVSLATSVALFPKLPYSVTKDLAPVSVIGRQPNVLAIHPGVKAATVKELLALARMQPGGLIYGSGGPGSSSHLATERLRLITKVDMTHVPYKGLASAMTDLIAGRVELIIATASTALSPIKANRVRALAVTTTTRFAPLPEVPTMIEAGVPNYEASTWYAVLVPAATPAPIVARLNQELGRIAADAAVKKQFAAQGLNTAHTSAEEAHTYVRSEIERWGEVIRVAGIKPN